MAACDHSPESATPSVQVETVPANPEDVSTIEGVMRAFYEVVNVTPTEAYFDGTCWWISNVAWTSESPQHPIPQEYLRRK